MFLILVFERFSVGDYDAGDGALEGQGKAPLLLFFSLAAYLSRFFVCRYRSNFEYESGYNFRYVFLLAIQCFSEKPHNVTQMEQFTRECLEIESDVNDLDHPLTSGDGRVGADLDSNIIVTGHLGSSMEKVYDRAAKLVKRTLDVEGVLVMDVSQCEMMFESLSGNARSSGGSVVGSGGGGAGETVGSVSITMHHGEPGMEMTRRQLMVEEGRNLMRFFDRFPEGRISEGIVPQSFKPFLPTHVQYALSEL
jgi:hypothetical protein